MRLVDCFFELFYYTLFIKSLGFSQLTYKNVIKHYKDLFSRSLHTAKKADFSQREWGKGFFAVCAWIDENVLCSEWPEKVKWQRYPLQSYFFKTTNAGEEFFIRLSRMSQGEDNIREVYDYCLALGFKGRFYDSKFSGELNKFIKSNLKQFAKTDNLRFPKIFFPKAYSPSSPAQKRMKGPWGISLFTLVIGILPVILFFILFYIYKNSLTEIVLHYFAAVI